MKVVLLFLIIHFFAVQIVRAEEAPVVRVAEEVKEAQKPIKVDECKDLLPQMESDYRDLEAKYRGLNDGSKSAQDGYLLSFNDMTKVLFQLTEARVQETQRIVESRNELSTVLEKFKLENSAEISNKLQDQYLDLTVRLYSAAMDSQRTIETLKEQITLVESHRGQLEKSKTDLEELDHQRLALEAKLLSLKIKCQPMKRY